MKRINAIQIETVWGYKTFELYQGDITNLDFGVDVLAVSALRGNYYPKKGTVVGALSENHQINLENLRGDCEFDLRKPFSCWVSKEIPNPKFKRILCVEMLDPTFSTEEVIKNVFVTLSILEAKGISVQKFASPLLGTGTLSLDPGLVIKTLLDNSVEYLKRSQNLKEIKFVAYDENLAEQLNKAMNEVLNRVTITVIHGELARIITSEIIDKLETAKSLIDDSNEGLFLEVGRIVSNEESRSFELGIAARKLLEFIVEDILKSSKGTLYQKVESIQKLSDPKIAEWITFSMHLLRVLGNESAHEKGSPDRVPLTLSKTDLELSLLCISRLLGFWIEFKRLSA